MISEWRELINKFNTDNPGSTRVLFTEAYANLTFTMKYYHDKDGKPRAHFPFNFLLIENLNEHSSANDFKTKIDEWFAELPPNATSNWFVFLLYSNFKLSSLKTTKIHENFQNKFF